MGESTSIVSATPGSIAWQIKIALIVHELLKVAGVLEVFRFYIRQWCDVEIRRFRRDTAANREIQSEVFLRGCGLKPSSGGKLPPMSNGNPWAAGLRRLRTDDLSALRAATAPEIGPGPSFSPHPRSIASFFADLAIVHDWVARNYPHDCVEQLEPIIPEAQIELQVRVGPSDQQMELDEWLWFRARVQFDGNLFDAETEDEVMFREYNMQSALKAVKEELVAKGVLLPRPVVHNPSQADVKYSTADLMEELGCQNSALRNYRKLAGVGAIRKGGRYDADERRRILSVASKTADAKISARAQQALAGIHG